jgi:diadenosine tetraphosphate (Ap4A) HIT family hydrolase/TM2 domain-containing membrane protein YozV
VSAAGCPECRVATGADTVHGLPALRLGPFVLHPKLEAPPVPGWLVVAPLRHVEQWDALDPAELRALGPLVARVSSALRAETPTAKVYVSVFAEVLPHFHVHVVARPPDLPAEERGARLFQSEGRAPEAEVQALARRVYAHLGSGEAGSGRPTRSSPWGPALLSALLFPGAGQFRNGRWAKGVAFTAATAFLLARIAWRVWADALDALLGAQAPLDLFGMWALAEEIRRRNAAEFSVLTLFLLGLWAISIFDAWRDATARR